MHPTLFHVTEPLFFQVTNKLPELDTLIHAGKAVVVVESKPSADGATQIDFSPMGR